MADDKDYTSLLGRSSGASWGDIAGAYLSGGKKKDSRARNVLLATLFFNAKEANMQSKVMKNLKELEDSKAIELAKLTKQWEKRTGLQTEYDKIQNDGAFKTYQTKLEEDFTKAYYLSSYYSLKHFGNPSDFGYSVLVMSFIYPFIIHAWFYWKYGMWMSMWSGSTHKRRNENQDICDPNKGCDLFYEEDINKRPCSLFYTVSSCV